MLSSFRKRIAAGLCACVAVGSVPAAAGAADAPVRDPQVGETPSSVGAARATLTAAQRASFWDDDTQAAPGQPKRAPFYPAQLYKRPLDWHRSQEALVTADNVLLFQTRSGGWLGWPYRVDMTRPLGKKTADAHRRRAGTFDNGGTSTQIRYLARVYTACQAKGQKDQRIERYRTAALRGLDFIINAQYPNGGWPQVPGGNGYHKHITFNDHVMALALELMQDVVEGKPHFAFVDEPRRRKAAAAVRKGIDCVLKCQVLLNGKRTAWCQQHDKTDLKPRGARRFEPAALTSNESVLVVQFLMRLDKPSPEVIQAVQSAVVWFAGPAKLSGIRQIKKADKVIVSDPTAPPLWARLYYLGTLGGKQWRLMDPVIIGRPIFADNDGSVYGSLEKISHERRMGYGWYDRRAGKLIYKLYPLWQARWAPNNNVLENAD